MEFPVHFEYLRAWTRYGECKHLVSDYKQDYSISLHTFLAKVEYALGLRKSSKERY